MEKYNYNPTKWGNNSTVIETTIEILDLFYKCRENNTNIEFDDVAVIVSEAIRGEGGLAYEEGYKTCAKERDYEESQRELYERRQKGLIW